MKVKITTFLNPFSFFCLPEDVMANYNNNNMQNINLAPAKNHSGVFANKTVLSEVTHGQYVAVLWNDCWVRGVISLETQFLIWLVDYGIYLRTNEKIVYVNLAAKDKLYPTKVFEASIHGCIPMDKIVNECEIEEAPSNTWSVGAIHKAQEMIAQAVRTYFVPIAMMSTKANDVVLGNLYLQIKDRGIVNVIDELENWPVFAKKDPQLYIENLSKIYISRRPHRASLEKPAMPVPLPAVSPELTISEYTAICANVPELEPSLCADSDEEGNTYLEPPCTIYTPSPEEIEQYSDMYITISGRKYNVLNVLTNKSRDLRMCEMYADQKYIGRANSRSSRL